MLDMSIRKVSDPMLQQPGARCLAIAWALLAAASMWSLPSQAAEPSAKDAVEPLDLTLPRSAEVWADVRTAGRDHEASRTRSSSTTGAAGGANGQPFGTGYEARMARSLPVAAGGSAVPAGTPRISGSAGGGSQTPAAPGTVRHSGAGRGR